MKKEQGERRPPAAQTNHYTIRSASFLASLKKKQPPEAIVMDQTSSRVIAKHFSHVESP